MSADRLEERRRARQDFRELVDLVAHTVWVACVVVGLLTATTLTVLAALHGQPVAAILPGSIGGASALCARYRKSHHLDGSASDSNHC
jgi:hypothetical protein